MSATILPPYFGSYEDLVRSLLHDPTLGSGHGRPHLTHLESELNPQPLPPREIQALLGPSPDPWRSSAIRYLAGLVSMQALAKAIPDKNISQQVAKGAEAGIMQFLDDFCGTPPRRVPWPWPGPPPWVVPLASELVMVANTMQPGELRDGLTTLAGRVVQRGFSQQAQTASAG